ncbi:MAG: hypothetical protein Q9227_007697 [Pyrenula ochraceoflavens]
MLSTLLHPSRALRESRQRDRSPFSSPFTAGSSPVATRRGEATERRRPAAYFDTAEESNGEDFEDYEDEEEEEEDQFEEEDDEDGVGDSTPLLPIFSAAHLDSLPIYNLTHAIRLLIIAKCETTLSWDQLRSPQVSQFLVKPIQQNILASHFSRATEYALMANCLQFGKEIDLHPGNSGTSKTRAMLCELLAIRLLKEFSTRELIDALSYDFDPLQGQTPLSTAAPGLTGTVTPNWDPVYRQKPHPRVARISCLEVAIRAQAKRFLSHPLVVQQLEAIWSGTIVFHSAADSMHRAPTKTIPNQMRGYGTTDGHHRALNASPSKLQPAKQRDHHSSVEIPLRRSVTLYDPRDASLFKLSRLRVPRYRNFLSTCSFAILLALFIAVLAERSVSITPLEIVFWFWSAGYMLDEVVGFNEQGFSLYLASFWNTFDLGIVAILLIHLGFRLYGVLMPDDQKHAVANMAYDVLAADAILLFPRLFSVLDHYRYFSQLLIAFRMMAKDFIALLVLILIACSGFFVALTLSFGNDRIDNPSSVAYVLFQILMGFTPAAWDRWSGYNTLGKTILTVFLCICHFLVVTILITVLTNSFMAIVQNANEEHQFLFAVNTISMVKSDALFSYVAPTNVLAWLITPIRYFIPFRRYIKLNRTVIKVTHFPILWSIYLYERTVLSNEIIESTDLVEPRGRSPGQANRLHLFSPKPRVIREHSVATWRKDRVLDEVFRRPFRDSVRGTQQSQDRRKTSNVVNTWMRNMGDSGVLSPPQEQDRGVVDRLESRRPLHKRSTALRRERTFTDGNRSVASDPEDFLNHADPIPPRPPRYGKKISTTMEEPADADDELVTNDNDDDDKATLDVQRTSTTVPDLRGVPKQIDYFNRQQPRHHPRTPPKQRLPQPSESYSSRASQTRFVSPSPIREHSGALGQSPKRARPHHSRNISTTTILYNPVGEPDVTEQSQSSSSATSPHRQRENAHPRQQPDTQPPIARSVPGSGTLTPASKLSSSNAAPNVAGRRTPKRAPAAANIGATARPRPIMPPKTNPAFQSAPNLAGLLISSKDRHHQRRSSLAMDIGSDIGDNKAIGGGFLNGGVPASFATQMAYATAAMRDRERAQRRKSAEEEDDRQGMFGRLMLARMNTLEEGLRVVVHEIRGTKTRSPSRERRKLHPTSASGSGDLSHQSSRKGRIATRLKENAQGRREEKESKRRSAIIVPQNPKNSADEEEWVDDEGGLENGRTGKGSSI